MGFKENLAFFKQVIQKNVIMRTQILIQASMAETITEKSNPKIVLNDSVIENDQQLVNEKSQESADEEDENGEEIQFEIPEDLTSEADEAETEAQIDVVTETKLQDRTQDGTKVGNNSAESVETDLQVKNKVVKMRGVEDYLGKNDLTKYENRKDSVTRLDNKIEKSSDQSESSDLKDLKQDSKNIQLHEIEKSKKSEVQNSEVRESAHLDSEMFYEDEIEDGRIPLCKFSL